MTDNSDNQDLQAAPDMDEERRSFLKKSVYAAYATPLITTLLVTEKAAADSYSDCVRECLDNTVPGGGRIIECIRNCRRFR
jgi:hypothetical protein